MANKTIHPTVANIIANLPDIAAAKADYDAAKKRWDAYNAQVKGVMSENGLTELTDGTHTVTLGKRTNRTFRVRDVVATVRRLKLDPGRFLKVIPTAIDTLPAEEQAKLPMTPVDSLTLHVS